MNRIAALLFAFVAISTAQALDITTRDGTLYSNVTVTAQEPDGIRIQHSEGVARIPFEKLPDALQKQYHFDPSKVAAYRKDVEDARRSAEANRLADAQRVAEAQRLAAKREGNQNLPAAPKTESPSKQDDNGEPSEAEKSRTRWKAGLELVLFLVISGVVAVICDLNGKREFAALIAFVWIATVVLVPISMAWHAIKDSWREAKLQVEEKQWKERQEQRRQEELRR